MTNHEFFPIIVALILLLLAFMNYRLRRAGQPLRLALAEKGEALLNEPELPTLARRHVENLLSTAFGMRGSLLLAIVAIPAIAVLFVIRQRVLTRSIERMHIPDPSLKARFYELCRLHDRLTLTNHFILLPIVEFEIVLFMPLAIVLRGMIRGVVPQTGGRESIITYIEEKRADGFHLPFSHQH